MNTVVDYLMNRASVAEMAEHLRLCDQNFVPPLSGRIEINDYAQKIFNSAMRFEAWSSATLVGLVAAYCNNQEKRIAYITSVSVLTEWTGKGIAVHLISLCIKQAKALEMQQICLEVASDNTPAIRLYEKHGFVAINANAPFVTMQLYLNSGEEHEQQA